MGLRDYGVILLRGYGVKSLHFSGLICLWGYKYIEFSDYLKGFLRLAYCYPICLKRHRKRHRI